MPLPHKIILITGASSGIGKATALALSRLQTHLVITARREALLSQVAQQITANGSEVLSIPSNALDEAHAEYLVQAAVACFGRIDIALLNVGSGPPLNTAKAACRIFLDTARFELRPYNIRVLTICPGFVVTEKKQDRWFTQTIRHQRRSRRAAYA